MPPQNEDQRVDDGSAAGESENEAGRRQIQEIINLGNRRFYNQLVESGFQNVPPGMTDQGDINNFIRNFNESGQAQQYRDMVEAQQQAKHDQEMARVRERESAAMRGAEGARLGFEPDDQRQDPIPMLSPEVREDLMDQIDRHIAQEEAAGNPVDREEILDKVRHKLWTDRWERTIYPSEKERRARGWVDPTISARDFWGKLDPELKPTPEEIEAAQREAHNAQMRRKFFEWSEARGRDLGVRGGDAMDPTHGSDWQRYYWDLSRKLGGGYPEYDPERDRAIPKEYDFMTKEWASDFSKRAEEALGKDWKKILNLPEGGFKPDDHSQVSQMREALEKELDFRKRQKEAAEANKSPYTMYGDIPDWVEQDEFGNPKRDTPSLRRFSRRLGRAGYPQKPTPMDAPFFEPFRRVYGTIRGPHRITWPPFSKRRDAPDNILKSIAEEDKRRGIAKPKVGKERPDSEIKEAVRGMDQDILDKLRASPELKSILGI